MFLMHPVCLGLSLFSALAYSLCLRGARAVGRSLRFLLPMALLAAAVNLSFNHAGVTILAYLPSGNPLTLESLLYGAAAAAMLAGVVLWFGCYSAVMTSDKFVYLFGRAIPALSLVLSMTLRFAPRFAVQMRAVHEAQRGIGRGANAGGLLRRAKSGVTLLSIMITWSLENAIETADSMKSRGYGLPGRTAFSLYHFGSRDRAALLWLLFCGVYIFSGWMADGLAWRYYPTLRGAGLTPFTASFMLAYLALCLTPVILRLAAARLWARAERRPTS